MTEKKRKICFFISLFHLTFHVYILQYRAYTYCSNKWKLITFWSVIYDIIASECQILLVVIQKMVAVNCNFNSLVIYIGNSLATKKMVIFSTDNGWWENVITYPVLPTAGGVSLSTCLHNCLSVYLCRCGVFAC